MDFDTQAGLIYSTLSDNEKDMIQYIRNHKSDVVGMPINELAKVLLSSKSSVLRLGTEARLYRLFRIKVFFKEGYSEESSCSYRFG